MVSVDGVEMIESVRGLPSVYNILSPAAYRAQENAGSEKVSTHLHQAQDEGAGVLVTLSQEALALVRGETEKNENQQNQTSETGTEEEKGTTGETELSQEEQHEVEELKTRDKEVRAHEQAHLAAAGNLATGGAHYEYEIGPDGQRYAIGGEVNISLREGDSPEETIRNAQQAQHAALAPADPSTQDRQVAAEASALINEARQEQAQLRAEGTQGTLSAGETKTVAMRGRHAFSVQSHLERGYLNGMVFSMMSIQT